MTLKFGKFRVVYEPAGVSLGPGEDFRYEYSPAREIVWRSASNFLDEEISELAKVRVRK